MTPLATEWWFRPVISAARVGEHSAVVWYVLYRSPLSASRWKLGVWIGPPKVLLAPNPTSSVRISRTLGAPAGASTPFGKSGVESLTVRPILPLNGGSGMGRTLPPAAAPDARGGGCGGGRAAEASAAAARELDPSSTWRRLSPEPRSDGRPLDFPSELFSLMAFLHRERCI